MALTAYGAWGPCMWAVPSCVCCFLLKFFHRVLLNLKEKWKFAPDVGSVNNAIWQTAGGESPTMPRWGTDVTVNKHLCHHKPARKNLWWSSIWHRSLHRPAFAKFPPCLFLSVDFLSQIRRQKIGIVSYVYTYKSHHSHILSYIMSLAFTCSSFFPPEKVTSHKTVGPLF